MASALPRVETVDLAPDLRIPRVLTGLWQIADMEKEGTSFDAHAAVEDMARYVAAGLDGFDMADHYGSAERIAGRFRDEHPRGREARMLTKWVPPPGPVREEDAGAAVDRARERLRAERLDLLQLHAWRFDDPAWLDALLWLDELRQAGPVRHLGVTNFDTAHLRVAISSGIPLVSNQVCFSLVDRRPRKAMVPLCRERGVGLLTYGTLAGGFLTERWLGAPEPEIGALGSWSLMKYARFIRVAGGWAAFQRLLEGVARVARRRGVSMANVACRWVLDEPGVSAIIVGARLGRSEHREETLRLFEWALDEEDRRELESAAEGLEVPGDCGDEYRRPPYLTAAGDLSHHVETLPSPYPVTEGRRGSCVRSGTVWEAVAGFSRALRRGDRIWVSGTTATHGDRVVGGDDAVAQTHFVIDKIEGALRALGAGLDDVVCTRVYLAEGAPWEPVARAHGERFGAVRPANTLVRAGIIGEGYLVEMEAEARMAGDGAAHRVTGA